MKPTLLKFVAVGASVTNAVVVGVVAFAFAGLIGHGFVGLTTIET